MSKEEKDIFSFVPLNASLMKVLDEVMSCITFIEKECKQNGLSRATVLKSQKQIKTILLQGNSKMHELGMVIWRFLSEEALLLDGDNELHNNSSDIIESTFGIFKDRKSLNKLYGVTSFVLFIPAYTKLIHKEDNKNKYSFKERLERLRVHQIHKWRKEHLPNNPVLKRRQTLKIAN